MKRRVSFLSSLEAEPSPLTPFSPPSISPRQEKFFQDAAASSARDRLSKSVTKSSLQPHHHRQMVHKYGESASEAENHPGGGASGNNGNKRTSSKHQLDLHKSPSTRQNNSEGSRKRSPSTEPINLSLSSLSTNQRGIANSNISSLSPIPSKEDAHDANSSSIVGSPHSMHPKRKSLYHHLQAEKNKFFVSTLRKHSSKLFQLKSHIKMQRSKWEQRLSLLDQWIQWNKGNILNSSTVNGGGKSPSAAFQELETIIQLWIMENDLMGLSNTQDRSVLLIRMDEKLNHLQSRGYKKKDIIPMKLFFPSDATAEEAALALERKEHDYDLTTALKEIFQDLLETDRLVLQKIDEPLTPSNDASVQTLDTALAEPNIMDDDVIDAWILSEHEQQQAEREPPSIENDPFRYNPKEHDDVLGSQEGNHFNPQNEPHDRQRNQSSPSDQSLAPSHSWNPDMQTNYESPRISSTPTDAEHSHYQQDVDSLTQTIQQQEYEISSLQKKSSLTQEENNQLSQQIHQLEQELQQQRLETEKQEKLYKKAKKQIESYRFQKHEMDQLQQELKFAEYKIQREKDRSKDELRSMKIQFEKMQDRMKENNRVKEFCKERLLAMENHIHNDSERASSTTDKLVLSMEQLLDVLERDEPHTTVASRVIPPKSAGRRRSSSRLRSGSTRRNSSSLPPPSASTVGSSIGEDSMLVETTVNLSEFMEVGQITQVLKNSLKQILDLERLLDITRKERNDYKADFLQWAEHFKQWKEMQKNAASTLSPSNRHSSPKKNNSLFTVEDTSAADLVDVLNTINATSRLHTTGKHTTHKNHLREAHGDMRTSSPQLGHLQDRSPAIEESKQQESTSPQNESDHARRSPPPPSVGGLFADDAVSDSPQPMAKRRPSLRKNGTPIFPRKRSRLLSNDSSRRNSLPGIHSANGVGNGVTSMKATLKGTGVRRVDTKSQKPPSSPMRLNRRRRSAVSVRVPNVSSGSDDTQQW